MEIEVINNITDEIYAEAEKLQGFTLYHTQMWHKFINDTFKWKTKALVSYDKDHNIKIFLPFIEKRRTNLKKYNISLPFSHKIGPAYKQPQDIDQALQNIDLPNLEVHEEINSNNFVKQQENYLVTLDLSNYESLEEVFKTFSKSSIQRKIKKAEKYGLTVKLSEQEEDHKHFYNMEVETRKRQGSPIYPAEFFQNLYENLKGRNIMHLFIAYHNDNPVAGIIFLHWKNTAIYAYGASKNDISTFRLGSNQLVMWEAIKHAYNAGIKEVDFGTTHKSHKSLLDYKLKWGGKSYPINYSYLKNAKSEQTISKIEREGLFFNLVTTSIKYLPTPLFKSLTPILLKSAI